MDKNYKDKLEEKIRELSKIKSVSAIILFGSQANGHAREDSDIDIAALMKKSNKKDEFKIRDCGNDKFDVHLFHNLPLIIQFRVISEGKILFIRDKDFVRDVSRYIIKKYLDFQPFIRRYYKGVIENGV